MTALVVMSAALGCEAAEPGRQATPVARTNAPADSAAPANSAPATTAAPWYRRTRVLDLTGDGQADTARLEAVGERPDSLRITLALVVDGEVKHREAWGSSYELALMDSSQRGGPSVEALLRARLDSVLSSVRIERFDAPGVVVMAEDSVILRGLEPRPTQRVSFAYGYETTVRLAWDAPRARFVRLWSCC